MLEEEVDLLFKKTDEKFERIDVLVAVAGAWSETKYISDRTLEEWNKTFSINSTAN